jgi:hydroxymethylbilane synthase
MLDSISEILRFDVMLPAPGQGALAVQCREDGDSRTLLAPLNHVETHLAVIAERAFLAGLDGGCSVPVAAYAFIEEGQLHLRGRVNSPDGGQQIDVQTQTSELQLHAAYALGTELAQEALAQGADKLLA